MVGPKGVVNILVGGRMPEEVVSVSNGGRMVARAGTEANAASLLDTTS